VGSRRVWASETVATLDGASGSCTALSSRVDALCAHMTCVETNKLTNRIEDSGESERTTPRMGFPSLGGWDGPAPSFQSQRLKVGGSAARWVFVVTTILDSLQMCCLVRIAHYANEPRQESVARQVRCGLSACSETARRAGGRDSCGQQGDFRSLRIGRTAQWAL